MGSFVSLGLVVLLFLSGCAGETPAPLTKKKEDVSSAKKVLNDFERYNKNKSNIPQMILPSVYEDVSVFDGESITFSAEQANLYKVLYSISKIAGLNLIIDKDVQNDIPVTLSVKDANLKDVLNIIMQMSGCYYTLDGNILHVKEYMRKIFNISYVHANSSFSTKLGGDTLSTATSGGSSGGSSSGQGISGKYSLNYETPKGDNDFYKHIDENIKSLISKKGTYTLNRFSGVLSVYDKKQNIDAISNLIKDVKKQFNKQILIEAKILEVSLNKSHQLGIDWDAVGHSVFSPGDKLSLGQTLGLTGAVAGTVSYNSTNFNALINAIDENGKIDTLSNPRIKVLNGQSAIISSGKLVPYWEKQVDTTQGTGTSDTQVTYNRRDVLDGVTMGVTPTVMDNGKIMLNITPISSSIEGEKNDPAGNSAPIINIKEAGTIIYAKDNDLVLIGGLISNSVSKKHTSVPILGDLPIIGSLFRQTNNVKEKKELVILLRIKVIE
jgi:MSHA biogenesis protein MshL